MCCLCPVAIALELYTSGYMASWLVDETCCPKREDWISQLKRQSRSSARRSDDTDARWDARRCFGRSDRSARCRWLRTERLRHLPRWGSCEEVESVSPLGSDRPGSAFMVRRLPRPDDSRRAELLLSRLRTARDRVRRTHPATDPFGVHPDGIEASGGLCGPTGPSNIPAAT
jgi:hypothetical protein